MAGDYHNALMRRLQVISDNSAASRNNTQMLVSRRPSAPPVGVGGAPVGGGQRGSYSNGRYKYEGSNDPYEFGKWLESQGFRVTENPRFGNGRVGTHSKNSRHYRGNAYDVNWGPGGQSAQEREQLAQIVAIARSLGYSEVIHNAPGHYGHAHIGW